MNYISFNKYFDRKLEHKPYVVNKITLGNGWSIEKLSTTFELSSYICPKVLSIFKALSHAIRSCNINDFCIIMRKYCIAVSSILQYYNGPILCFTERMIETCVIQLLLYFIYFSTYLFASM